MLKFLKLTKNQPNNQSPGAIPGYLFRDGHEEDGFIIIGDSDPEVGLLEKASITVY